MALLLQEYDIIDYFGIICKKMLVTYVYLCYNPKHKEIKYVVMIVAQRFWEISEFERESEL